MSDSHCDALVFFGATGDLAFRKIFPSLQGMVKRGHLTLPVVGVTRSGNLDRLRTRARDSRGKHGGSMPKRLGGFPVCSATCPAITRTRRCFRPSAPRSAAPTG